MPQSSTHGPFHWRPALRSPVALVAAIVAASVAFALTHLLWLGDYLEQ